MKKPSIAMVMIAAALAAAYAEPALTVTDFGIRGAIEGENIAFTITGAVDVAARDARLVLAAGDLACLDSGALPRHSELLREGDRYVALFQRRGTQTFGFKFAAAAVREGDWRIARFLLPDAAVRRITLQCDRPDLEVESPGALGFARQTNAAGQVEISALLGAGRDFLVRWKPKVQTLTGELAVTCEGHTIARAGVGALRLNTLYTYRVAQGSLRALAFALPPDLNITQVRGEDIREWTLEPAAAGKGRRLLVTLSRPKESLYQIQVEGELVLPAFPCAFTMPAIAPEGVVRTSGFLLSGADGAVKLLLRKSSGLTQVDQTAFPAARMDNGPERQTPARSLYAYQYAGMPYTLELSAEDVVTSLQSEQSLLLTLTDNDLQLQAGIELDIRDAPAREVAIAIPAGWTVATCAGGAVSDYDVRGSGTNRAVHVFFRDAVLGHTRVDLRLEHSLAAGDKTFPAPCITVRDARAERGYLALRAEKGVRLKAQNAAGLREVHTASLPVRLPDAQMAYRFKEPNWSLSVAVEKTAPTIDAESFHLVTVGDAALFGLCSITYHIEGAPVRALRMEIPATYRNVEFTGRGIRGWEQTGTVWVVTFQEKLLGDYTLLVTYEQPFVFEGGEVPAGGIRIEGVESEVGYVTLAGAASLAFDRVVRADPAILTVERAELPQAYKLLVNDPILCVFKYAGGPHQASLAVRRYPTRPLLDQVADHTTLQTTLSREGEAVTTVGYYVKNASRQHLAVSLPPGARLWSARVNGADVQALDVPGKPGAILVPLQRRRDPDEAARIEIVYAETRPAFHFRGNPAFTAPSADAQAVFTTWTVIPPENYAVIGAGGTLLPTGGAAAGGSVQLALGVQHAVGLVLFHYGWLLAGALLSFGLLCLIVRNAGRRRLIAWSSLLAALGALFIVAFALRMQGMSWPSRALLPSTPVSCSFARPVNLAGSEPSIVVSVMPRWLGAAGSLSGAIAGVLAGLYLLATVRRRGQTRAALGALALLAGLACLEVTRPWALGLTLSLMPLAIAFGLLSRAWAAGRRRAFSDNDAPTPQPPPVPASPLPPVTPAVAALALALAFGTVMPAQAGGKGGVSAKPSASATVAVPAECLAAPPVLCTLTNPNLPPTLAVDAAVLDIQGPATTARDANLYATVTATLEFEAKATGVFRLMNAPAVLQSFKLNSSDLELRASDGAPQLVVGDTGKYKITLVWLTPVVVRENGWEVRPWLPANLRNRVTLRLPAASLDAQSPDAVYLKTDEDQAQGRTTVTAVFGSDVAPVLIWKPVERRTKLEKVSVFAEVNSVAAFDPGVVTLTHTIRYEIAQGELQSFALRVPSNLTATAVSARGLSTWRFDPATHRVEALLEKPVSGALTLTVVTQMPQEGAPYDAILEAPVIEAVARQRGALALTAPDAMQVRAEALDGVAAMSPSDFPAAAGGAAVKRAFRYHQLPARVQAHAERVLPEIRVVEDGRFDLSDERLVRSARLTVTVARAGIFSLRLALPPDFDIESLTGSDVSHWDETRDASGRVAIVNFDKQALGERTLNIVVSRTGKGLDASIAAPRLGVEGAIKHTGVLLVSGERGVRLTTTTRDGVSEMNPAEVGITQAGALAFRLLRPDWQLMLRTDVLAPVIRVEGVQTVHLSEGLIQGRAFLDYRIDNAGVKFLTLQAPQPGVALAFSGRNIARVQETDKAAGLWQVELQGKVENLYRLEVGYQIPCATKTNAVLLRAVRTVGSESQKGYLAVTASPRLRIAVNAVPPGFQSEDARGIPSSFRAGDLSDAVLCYRTTQPDFALPVTLVRHESASVLAATVQHVQLQTVVAGDDQSVTRAQLEMRVGDLRFLRTTLPPASQVWAVFVNGRSTVPLVEGDALLVPLDLAPAGETVSVELLYGVRGATARLGRRHTYAGPRFDLPLADIAWTFYLPSDWRCYSFGGTLNHRSGAAAPAQVFDDRSYLAANTFESQRAHSKAATNLKQGEQMAREGRQEQAKKAFETALYYSQGQSDFNEDVRVQYRNLARQQAVVGLVNRRDNLRQARNVQDEQTANNITGFNKGNWNDDYGKQVTQQLSAEDNGALNAVADKILVQQEAAAATVNPIHITLPMHGRAQFFFRQLQVRPGGELTVNFKALRPGSAGWLLMTGALVAGFLLFRALLWLAIPRPQTATR